MGIVARVIGWIWRRWGDWQSVVAILDAVDLKTWALGILTVVVTFLWGVLYNEMTPIQIYLYALGAGAFVVVICAGIRFLWTIWHRPTPVAEPAVAPPGGPFPDWKLHDLFLHIDPLVFETDKKLAIGQEVKDKLSTGRLKSWGR